MIYVTSDLHGCDPKDFTRLLEKAGFTDADYLFVLGDVIDRGEHGVEWLQWLTQTTNAQLILGNHEVFMLSCRFLFDPATEENLSQLTAEQFTMLKNWMANGGGTTLNGLRDLLYKDPEQIDSILDYLQDAPLYEDLTVNGRRYVLVHGGLGNFAPDKGLDEYDPYDLVWERPGLNDRYFEDATVIFGHTPTVYFGMENRGRMLRTDTWCCIDTGAAMGDMPMLLRLEDEQAFYLD